MYKATTFTYVTFMVLVYLSLLNSAFSSSEAGCDSRPSPALRVHSPLIRPTTRSPAPSAARITHICSGTAVNFCSCVPLLRCIPSCTLAVVLASSWRSKSSANLEAYWLLEPFCSTSAYWVKASAGVATSFSSFAVPICEPIVGISNFGSLAPSNSRAMAISL